MNKFGKLAISAAVAVSAISSASISFAPDTKAQAGTASFQGYLNEVKTRAIQQGVSAQTANRVLSSLKYNDRVVRLDRKQPGGGPSSKTIPPFAPYKRRHVDAARINGGRSKYRQIGSLLRRVEQQTGVPAQMMVAIYGHETNYGSYTGNFNAPEALASLAYEGRRRSLFEGELIAVLKMIDSGVPQYAITGSWAGALGKPQFLPSVYLKLAKDGDGDGYADIWRSEADAMASIANYFVNSGWRRGQEWGFAVNVPSSLSRAAIKSKITPTRCKRVFERHSAWKTVAEWERLGVRPQRGYYPRDKNMMLTLLEPDGQGNTAYLLGSNYRVILDYNCSNFYALSVGLLADEIRR